MTTQTVTVARDEWDAMRQALADLRLKHVRLMSAGRALLLAAERVVNHPAFDSTGGNDADVGALCDKIDAYLKEVRVA